MIKEYFYKYFESESELIKFLNDRADVNVVSITYNARLLTPRYVLFYWCYEPDNRK